MGQGNSWARYPVQHNHGQTFSNFFFYSKISFSGLRTVLNIMPIKNWTRKTKLGGKKDAGWARGRRGRFSVSKHGDFWAFIFFRLCRCVCGRGALKVSLLTWAMAMQRVHVLKKKVHRGLITFRYEVDSRRPCLENATANFMWLRSCQGQKFNGHSLITTSHHAGPHATPRAPTPSGREPEKRYWRRGKFFLTRPGWRQ